MGAVSTNASTYQATTGACATMDSCWPTMDTTVWVTQFFNALFPFVCVSYNRIQTSMTFVVFCKITKLCSKWEHLEYLVCVCILRAHLVMMGNLYISVCVYMFRHRHQVQTFISGYVNEMSTLRYKNEYVCLSVCTFVLVPIKPVWLRTPCSHSRSVISWRVSMICAVLCSFLCTAGRRSGLKSSPADIWLCFSTDRSDHLGRVLCYPLAVSQTSVFFSPAPCNMQDCMDVLKHTLSHRSCAAD